MAWKPLQRADTDPNFIRNPSSGAGPDDEVWTNWQYQVVVRYMRPEGIDSPEKDDPDFDRDAVMLHLSIHRDSRKPVRDWRHLQQIKNEIAGEERWACELFPPEEHLVDTSNEYHLWVFPKGATPGFGFKEGTLVASDEQTEKYNKTREAGIHRGRQEPFEEGLTTGAGRNDNPDPRLDAHLDQLEAQARQRGAI